MVAYVIFRESLSIHPTTQVFRAVRAPAYEGLVKRNGFPGLPLRPGHSIVGGPQDLQIRFKTHRFRHLRRSSLGSESQSRNPSPGVQSQDSKPWNPSPGIQAQDSKARNPNPGIQTQESKRRNLNLGLQTQESEPIFYY